MTRSRRLITRDFHHHPRDWRGFLYVYPVISRRSRGLSIGVNLNPDTACNFDCIYCQVDRTRTPAVRDVDLTVLREELDAMLAAATGGGIFSEPEFAATPAPLRRLNDIAFSGDGEPTTCPLFKECVELVIELKGAHGASDVPIVVITDACYLTRPNVVAALECLDRSNGVVWAKLDAGTEEYYRLVNRPNYPLSHVLENILQTARVRPVVIQSLFMRIAGAGPGEAEIAAFADRLRTLLDARAQIDLVQVYTVARPPAQDDVTALSADQLGAIGRLVTERTGLRVEVYHP